MKRLSFLLLPFFLALCILAPIQGLAQAPPAEYKSGINWRAYQGQTINVLFSAHPWQEAIMPFIPATQQRKGDVHAEIALGFQQEFDLLSSP